MNQPLTGGQICREIATKVGFGSEAALMAPVYDFRFAPDSGLRSDIADGPFRANRRHRSQVVVHVPCATFPMPTQSAKTVVSPCLACHVTIAYPHVGFTRNYSAAGLRPGLYLAMDSPEQPAAQ